MTHVFALDHDTVIVDGIRYLPLPAGTFENGFAAFLDRVSAKFDGEGVVLLSEAATAEFGIEAGIPSLRVRMDVAGQARAAGWKVTEIRAWTTFRAPDERTNVHVGIHPWILADPQKKTGAMIGTFEEMAVDLTRYHQLTGTPFHATPGVTGIGAIRGSWAPKRKNVFWHPTKEWPEGTSNCENNFSWETADQPAGDHHHSYDVNKMFLSAMAASELAYDKLEYEASPTFDKKRAGYWRIPNPYWALRELPNPLGTRSVPTGDLIWVTTPTMRLLQELGDEGFVGLEDIAESWTAPGACVLRPYAEKLRDALVDAKDGGDERVEKAIKQTFQMITGMMAKSTSRIYRPDWRHTIVAQARCNLFRKMNTVYRQEARTPIAVKTDCVTYASDETSAIDACPKSFILGDRLGQFKVETK